jgi:hypothetical protein
VEEKKMKGAEESKQYAVFRNIRRRIDTIIDICANDV